MTFGELPVGGVGRWCGIRFLKVSEERVSAYLSDVPHVKVVYLDPTTRTKDSDGNPVDPFPAGSKGLMPENEECEVCQ